MSFFLKHLPFFKNIFIVTTRQRIKIIIKYLHANGKKWVKLKVFISCKEILKNK